MAKKYANYELSPQERADAREALKILGGSGLSLTAAALRALQGRRALRRICIAEAVGDFQRTRLELRARTFEWYESNLKPLTEQFGDDNVDEVDRARFMAWIGAKSEAERRRITRAARAFFRWCIAQEPQITTIDPTHGVMANVTSISLTAGDWDVTGMMSFGYDAATVTDVLAGTSSTSAFLITANSAGGLRQFTTVTGSDAFALPTVRFSLSATTTIYLPAYASFSAGSVTATGVIRARRIR